MLTFFQTWLQIYNKNSGFWAISRMIKSSRKIADQLDYFSYHPAQCFPISSLLLSLNVTHVDVFSLDVEGKDSLNKSNKTDFRYSIKF